MNGIYRSRVSDCRPALFSPQSRTRRSCLPPRKQKRLARAIARAVQVALPTLRRMDCRNQSCSRLQGPARRPARRTRNPPPGAVHHLAGCRSPLCCLHPSHRSAQAGLASTPGRMGSIQETTGSTPGPLAATQNRISGHSTSLSLPADCSHLKASLLQQLAPRRFPRMLRRQAVPPPRRSSSLCRPLMSRIPPTLHDLPLGIPSVISVLPDCQRREVCRFRRLHLHPKVMPMAKNMAMVKGSTLGGQIPTRSAALGSPASLRQEVYQSLRLLLRLTVILMMKDNPPGDLTSTHSVASGSPAFLRRLVDSLRALCQLLCRLAPLQTTPTRIGLADLTLARCDLVKVIRRAIGA